MEPWIEEIRICYKDTLYLHAKPDNDQLEVWNVKELLGVSNIIVKLLISKLVKDISSNSTGIPRLVINRKAIETYCKNLDS